MGRPAPTVGSRRTIKATLIGLDIGSTVVKAARFDLRGRTLAIAQRQVPVSMLRPGWIERDPEAVWRAAVSCLRAVAASDVAAIGLTGCGNGAVFVDVKGTPVHPGLLSSDQRAAGWEQSRPGVQGYSGQLSALAAWLRAERPAIARRVARALFWKDFVRARLTGEFATDFTDAGASGSFDPWLPPARSSTALAGAVLPQVARATRLPAGIPTVTGCIDCEAVALGSGIHAPGDVSIVAGTWSINQTYMAQRPRYRGHFLVNPSVMPDLWLVLEGSPSSAANFDWARRTFGGRLGAAAATAEAARTSRSGLLFIPQVPTGRGAFVGLDVAHGRGDLFRAVMEGVVFAHRAHVEKLPSARGAARRVTLGGGAARSSFWCQLFADGLGCVVDVPECEQLGALGAAICAGIGIGVWPSVPVAQKVLVARKISFRPNAKRQADLNRDYVRFRQYCLSSSP